MSETRNDKIKRYAETEVEPVIIPPMREHKHGGWVRYEAHLKTITNAVKAERERCASIAEKCEGSHGERIAETLRRGEGGGEVMSDLSLIPLDDLAKEIERRSVCMVLAYQTYADKDKNGDMFFRYGKGNWSQAVALSSILKNDLLNNWNNELQTLQRIAEEGLF